MSQRSVPSSSTVYTPDVLAAAMVAALGDESSSVWLDPCVGDGAFVAGIAALGVPRGRVFAFDLSRARGNADALAQTKRGVDFVEWALLRRKAATFDRVVMNPPYVAIGRLRGGPRANALKVPLAGGLTLPLQANYWCAFVLLAMRAIRPGGSLAAVLPAAWDYARYANPVKDAISAGFGELTVVRSGSPLFPGVLEGAVIVVAKNRGEQPCIVRRVEVSGAKAAGEALFSIGEGKVPSRASVVRSIGKKDLTEVPFRNLADVLIGGVTGDASYFLLTEAERNELMLPRDAVRPVVTRARHLRHAFLSKTEWKRLLDEGERVWLFSPTDSVLRHPEVKRYLQQGLNGRCDTQRFKVQSREPWYRTPLPQRVDGFLSGMSKRLPFLVMREMPGLTATNTLYVVRFKARIDASTRLGIGVAFLSSRVRRALQARARIYADGLLKFEPAELSAMKIAVPEHLVGVKAVYASATKLLLNGDEAAAEALADEWLVGRGPSPAKSKHHVNEFLQVAR